MKRDVLKVVIFPWDERTMMSEDPVWVAKAYWHDELRVPGSKIHIADVPNDKVYVENRHLWDIRVPRWNGQDFQQFERKQVMFITKFTDDVPMRGNVMRAYLDDIRRTYDISTVQDTIQHAPEQTIVHLPVDIED